MGKTLFWIIIGILSIIGGIFALANPVFATLTAVQIAAYIFIFLGVVQLIGAFSVEGFGAKVWNALLGALAIWLGIAILGQPLAGVIALTTLVAVVFLVTGIVKLVLAFSLRGETGPFWLILLSGATSVLLAILIFSNFPQSAATVLGILLGVDLISNGVSLIAMGLALRRSTT